MPSYGYTRYLGTYITVQKVKFIPDAEARYNRLKGIQMLKYITRGLELYQILRYVTKGLRATPDIEVPYTYVLVYRILKYTTEVKKVFQTQRSVPEKEVYQILRYITEGYEVFQILRYTVHYPR
jgi:hypothetical protein